MNRHLHHAPAWRETVGRDPYASRVSTTPELVPRQEPVVYGADGPLSRAQLGSYEFDGYFVLPDRLPVEDVRSVLDETNLATAHDGLPIVRHVGGIGVRSVYRVHRAGPVLAALCSHPSLVGAARQILGSDVTVLQSRVDFRSLEGTEFYWRSDFESWHVEDGLPEMRTVIACVQLTETFEGDGPLLVVPGSHRTFAPCPDPARLAQEPSTRRLEPVVPRSTLQWMVDDRGIRALRGEPGTVALLDCNLLHATPATLSPRPGATLFVAYNSVENALVAPFGGHDSRAEHFAERGATNG